MFRIIDKIKSLNWDIEFQIYHSIEELNPKSRKKWEPSPSSHTHLSRLQLTHIDQNSPLQVYPTHIIYNYFQLTIIYTRKLLLLYTAQHTTVMFKSLLVRKPSQKNEP